MLDYLFGWLTDWYLSCLLSQNKSAKDKCTQISQLDTFYPRAGIGLRHFIVNSDVIGSIKRQHNDSSLFCLCTLDGHYALIDANSSGKLVFASIKSSSIYSKRFSPECQPGTHFLAIEVSPFSIRPWCSIWLTTRHPEPRHPKPRHPKPRHRAVVWQVPFLVTLIPIFTPGSRCFWLHK